MMDMCDPFYTETELFEHWRTAQIDRFVYPSERISSIGRLYPIMSVNVFVQVFRVTFFVWIYNNTSRAVDADARRVFVFGTFQACGSESSTMAAVFDDQNTFLAYPYVYPLQMVFIESRFVFYIFRQLV